eukprot:6491429-Amphidinium_carterae.2
MLLDDESYLMQLENGAVPQGYLDPILKYREDVYLGFVLHLRRIGMIQWTLRPGAHVGLFCVKKKGDRQRLITDCRPANARFRKPPGVSLATSESFGGLQLQEGVELFCAETDIENCFHNLRIAENFGRFFSLPPLLARQLDITMVQGQVVHCDRLVYPCFAVLPMGMTWSLYFAQQVSERLVRQALRSRSPKFFSLQGEQVALNADSEIGVYVYVDNIGVMAGQKGIADECIKLVEQELRDAGLPIHASTGASREATVLGVELDGKDGIFSISRKRLWRIKYVGEWLLKRRKVRGQQLECWLGHCTFAAMLQRCLLTPFHTIYRFIRKHYEDAGPLWPSVRKEIECFVGLLPLCYATCHAPWSCEVVCYDSCPEGRGCCFAGVEEPLIKQVSLLRERQRFKRTLGGEAARRHALRELSVFDPASVRTPAPQIDESLENVHICDDFTEVTASVMARPWCVMRSRPWSYREAVHLGEARSAVEAFKLACMIVERQLPACRLLRLGDNLGVVLALERHRSCVHSLLKIVRKSAALELAFQVRCYDRWVPSEWNPSDSPSRVFGEEHERFVLFVPPAAEHRAAALSSLESFKILGNLFLDTHGQGGSATMSEATVNNSNTNSSNSDNSSNHTTHPSAADKNRQACGATLLEATSPPLAADKNRQYWGAAMSEATGISACAASATTQGPGRREDLDRLPIRVRGRDGGSQLSSLLYPGSRWRQRRPKAYLVGAQSCEPGYSSEVLDPRERVHGVGRLSTHAARERQPGGLCSCKVSQPHLLHEGRPLSCSVHRDGLDGPSPYLWPGRPPELGQILAVPPGLEALATS